MSEESAQQSFPIDKFLENQSRELEIRSQEVQLRAHEITANQELALKSLDAQERDRKDTRDKFNQNLKHRYFFIAALVTILLLFAGYAIKNEAKDLVIDIFKILVGFAAGGFGGYHYGKSKASENQGG